MSRSYKRNPYVTDNGNSKYGKRLANRTVRRRLRQADEDTTGRIQHKKMTESYNICDYKWRMTRAEAIEWYEEQLLRHKSHGTEDRFLQHYPTLDTWLKYWDKCHRRK